MKLILGRFSTQFDSIAWKNGQDFSPETLYIKSIIK